MSKNYETYDFNSFITDENFKSWVLSPSKESDYYWQSWLNNHPEKAELVSTAKEFILSVKFTSKKPSEEAKSDIYKKVIERSKVSVQSVNEGRKVLSYVGWQRIAAAITLIAGFIWLYFNSPFADTSGTEIVNYETKITRAGEKLTVMLPDGSSVKLNSESSLRYPITFNKVRRVFLTGEGFFEVEKDPKRPFVVETKTLATTALGTSFNVNAYIPEEEEVFLITGKVRVDLIERSGLSQTLIPGEKVELRDGKMNKILDNSLSEIKWKDGVLVFKSTPFDEGIHQLERWYGANIVVKNRPSDSELYVTGYFDHQSLSNILSSLGYSLAFEYEIIDKNVLITFN